MWMKLENGMLKKMDGPTWDTITSSVETVSSRLEGRLKDLAPMLKISMPIQSVYAGLVAFRRTGRLKITGRLIRALLSSISFKTFKKSSRGPLS